MNKNREIQVLDKEIHINESDYFSLTDIARYKNPLEPKEAVRNWLRRKDTIEYLGLWEQLNNPNFKGVEFDAFKNQAGTNAFTLSPERWIERTSAIDLQQNAENIIVELMHTKILLCNLLHGFLQR